VNTLLRLAAAPALLLLAIAAPALADGPGATGAYLSGLEASDSMSTHEAAQFFGDAAADEWDNPIVLNEAFIAFVSDGRIGDALNVAHHLSDLQPDNDMVKLVVATVALKERRYDDAVTELDKIGSNSFEGVTGAVLKAWAITGQGRLDDAFKSLDTVGDNGLAEFLIFHRAIMAEVAGRTDDAVKYISQAHDGDPYTADVVEAYASILANAGQPDKAVDAVVGFESQGLNFPGVTAIKQALVDKQRPPLYADSVQAGAAEMFHSIGVAITRDGTEQDALVMFRLANYLDPRNDAITLVLGQLYDDAGQHEIADDLYNGVAATSPYKPMATVRVADNLDATGDRAEAIRRLGNIVTTNPNDIDAVSVLGDLYRSDKQYQAAVGEYTRALAITGGQSPGDWRFYYVRGIAYERSEQFPSAEKDFLKALDLNPNQPQVLNYLGYSWVDKGMNLNRALGMIQKAVAASPNDGYIIDSLGWAYYRLGRFADAVTELEQAATLMPNDPEINDHLGDAYWQVGRKLEAHFQWNVAYSLDKDGDVKARVAPKLTGGLDAAPKDGESAPILDTPPGDQAQAVPAN
jgi:tetratricopeptide (TPR) repeat protein